MKIWNNSDVSSKKNLSRILILSDVNDREPVLTWDQIFRLLDAKCVDSGNAITSNQAEMLKDFITANSFNRKLNLVNLSLGKEWVKCIKEFIKEGTGISRLNLSSNNIKDEGAQILAQIIRSFHDMIHLDISSNEITPKGCAVLFEAISESNSLISLNISSVDHSNKNRIGLEGAYALSETLNSNVFLQFLNLSSTCLGDQGLEIISNGLCNSSIWTLILKSNDFTANWMESVCKILMYTYIWQLDLSKNRIFSHTSMRVFSECLSQEYLSLKVLKLK